MLESSQMLTCHLYFFFDDMPVQVFCPLFNWVVFLLLSFKSSLYILANGLLSAVLFANIFSYSMAFFILLIFAF